MEQIDRRRQGEHHWPGVGWRKWLHRESRDGGFSIAEESCESGSGSDDEVDCLEHGRSNEGKRRDKLESGQSENLPEVFPYRLRRRNSEALRAQYIDTKEVRICVGTWNVGGRKPPDDLDIDDWLDMEEPADVYVLGFQEIVPLNAHNILGHSDSRPALLWEHLIQESLNRIHPSKPKYKCYSDPPSPSKFKPADDDQILEDDIFASESEGEEGIHPVDEDQISVSREVDDNNSTEKESSAEVEDDNCAKKAIEIQQPIKRLDRLHRLKYEEHNTDSTDSSNQLKPTLSKSLSKSERIGLSSPEQSMNLVPQRALENSLSNKPVKSFRACNSFKPPSGGKHQSLQDAFLLQELDLESLVRRKRRPNFVRLVSKQMVGIFLSIWVRKGLRRHIQNLKISTVGVGVMGYIGNKGSISVSMSIYKTPFCFICTHLTSGEKEGDELRRNADVQEIHRRTHFNAKSILDHERIIWLGDLNYRLNLSYEKTKELISKKNWSSMSEKDQLTRELRKGRAFDGWKEGRLNFPPTYKYDFNSDNYIGEDPKSGRRTPAWCDRILSFGKGMKLLKYRRVENKLSDHRPVSATFMAEAEVFSHRKLQKALSITDAEIENSEILTEFDVEAALISLHDAVEDPSGWQRFYL